METIGLGMEEWSRSVLVVTEVDHAVASLLHPVTGNESESATMIGNESVNDETVTIEEANTLPQDRPTEELQGVRQGIMVPDSMATIEAPQGPAGLEA
jgi:hypothetical protein